MVIYIVNKSAIPFHLVSPNSGSVPRPWAVKGSTQTCQHVSFVDWCWAIFVRWHLRTVYDYRVGFCNFEIAGKITEIYVILDDLFSVPWKYCFMILMWKIQKFIALNVALMKYPNIRIEFLQLKNMLHWAESVIQIFTIFVVI